MTCAPTLRFATAAFAMVLCAGAAQAAWQTPSVDTTTLAQDQSLPAPGITATISAPFYTITSSNVGEAIAEQLKTQGVEDKAEVTMNPGTPTVMFSADHPIKIAIHTLQVDTAAHRWQAQAYFLGNGKTESVKPIAGTYGTLVDVPELTRQFTKNDIIAESDIHIVPTPERLLRKDTITDPKQLIGQSPRNSVSPNRPLHANEITSPIVIKKGDLVEMGFNTDYIHIKTTGIALEDGAKGATIRVKNQKSERTVSAKVEAPGRVQVNNDVAM